MSVLRSEGMIVKIEIITWNTKHTFIALQIKTSYEAENQSTPDICHCIHKFASNCVLSIEIFDNIKMQIMHSRILLACNILLEENLLK